MNFQKIWRHILIQVGDFWNTFTSLDFEMGHVNNQPRTAINLDLAMGMHAFPCWIALVQVNLQAATTCTKPWCQITVYSTVLHACCWFDNRVIQFTSTTFGFISLLLYKPRHTQNLKFSSKVKYQNAMTKLVKFSDVWDFTFVDPQFFFK